MNSNKIAQELIRIAKDLVAAQALFTDNGEELIRKLNNYFKKLKWEGDPSKLKDAVRMGWFRWKKNLVNSMPDYDDLKDSFENYMPPHRQKQMLDKFGADDFNGLYQAMIKVHDVEKAQVLQDGQKAVMEAIAAGMPKDYVEIEYQKHVRGDWVSFVIRNNNRLIMYR